LPAELPRFAAAPEEDAAILRRMQLRRAALAWPISTFLLLTGVDATSAAAGPFQEEEADTRRTDEPEPGPSPLVAFGLTAATTAVGWSAMLLAGPLDSGELALAGFLWAAAVPSGGHVYTRDRGPLIASGVIRGVGGTTAAIGGLLIFTGFFECFGAGLDGMTEEGDCDDNGGETLIIVGLGAIAAAQAFDLVDAPFSAMRARRARRAGQQSRSSQGSTVLTPLLLRGGGGLGLHVTF
jgi:hypothetical protein